MRRMSNCSRSGFIASFGDMLSRVRAGKTFMTLTPDEVPLAPVALAPELDHVAALSSRGRLLVFAIDEMREVPRGRGVIIMGLEGEERLTAIGLATASRVALQGTNPLGPFSGGGHRGRRACEVSAAARAQRFAGEEAHQGSGLRPNAAAAGVRRQFVIPLAPRGSPPPTL